MAFPSTGIVDDFNRADQAGLGASWVDPFRGTEASLDIASNCAVHPTGTGGAGARWSDGFGPDCEAFVTLLTAEVGTLKQVQVYVRIQGSGSTVDGYGAVQQSTPDEVSLIRLDNNVATLLSSVSLTFAAGDKLGIEAVGGVITCYVFQAGSWTFAHIVPDSTYALAGQIAVRLSATASILEEFGGGTTVLPPDTERTGGMVMAGP